MKKSFLLFAVTFLVAALNAQYKKASFLNKSGRIYDVGTAARIQNGGRSSSIGFFVSYGKEKASKRLHHWFDLELNLGNKYNYTSPANNSTSSVQVSGKTGLDFAYRYNLAFFLADNSNEEKKVLPFINLSVGYTYGSGHNNNYTENPDNGSSLQKYPIENNSNIHYGAGAGVVYRINQKIGIRGSVAYYGITDTGNPAYNYSTIAKHPAVSVGVRFRMERDDE